MDNQQALLEPREKRKFSIIMQSKLIKQVRNCEEMEEEMEKRDTCCRDMSSGICRVGRVKVTEEVFPE